MSRDVIIVGSTVRIPLLYRGDYSQWRERFMNYLEEQTDGEAMINSIQNDLWDALERQMCGSEYAEQDKKAAILYEYETFKDTKGEQLLDTYLHYLQVINDLKKEWTKLTNNNLRTSSASSSANKKPEYVKSVERKEDKKADEKKRDMSKVKCYNCKKE
nr:hypothetical protein [Tanacetum cinerariifolium]